ncbi:MAG: DUF1553 domain-containing protein [Lentisphaeria bacterium]|nr:DUF1553 domain-containing protein [Lentisphaeria bacterium]
MSGSSGRVRRHTVGPFRPARPVSSGPRCMAETFVRAVAAGLLLALLPGPTALAGAEREPVRPFECGAPFVAAHPIDACVLADLTRRGLRPAPLCSDEVFVRRAWIDIAGTLPGAQDVRRFLDDTRAGKRAILVDELLVRDEFADLWSLKWCDLLRVKAEFPINLWPNAVQAYHVWVRQAVRENLPYDRFAHALLTSSGSNFRVPPVNFYRAVQSREPGGIAAAVALSFLGSRIETWPAEQRRGLEAFFSRVAYKGTGEWKEEIVYPDPTADTPLAAAFPDGREVTIPVGSDPRRVFADWLLAPGNSWFSRALVNRAWSWFLGRGIVHEPDDIRPDNPPVNPALLACLEGAFVEARYDLRALFRFILTSQTYQQSCIPREAWCPEVEEAFAVYPVRRLDAEVLIDALCGLGHTAERYSSLIPEPFTFIPETQRTIALADGSISSPFLEMFGRPARDTGLESERSNQPSEAQRLHLLNSSHIRGRVLNGPGLTALLRDAKGKPEQAVDRLYLGILSRQPTPEETRLALDHMRTAGMTPQQAAADLAWALINSKEFLYRH